MCVQYCSDVARTLPGAIRVVSAIQPNASGGDILEGLSGPDWLSAGGQLNAQETGARSKTGREAAFGRGTDEECRVSLSLCCIVMNKKRCWTLKIE